MKALTQISLIAVMALFIIAPTMADDEKKADEAAKEKLAKESVEKCKSTESTKPTPKMIMEKVDKACELLEKEGEAAYPKFKGKDSEFLYAGTYIWIHDLKGTMLMHPIKYKLDGKSVLNMKDANGKLLFAEMNQVAEEHGSGWVAYVWPKPGEKKPSPKFSYVRLVKHEDKTFIAGSGAYDLSPEEIEKAKQEHAK